MSFLSGSLSWLRSVDVDDVIQSGVSFAAAHAGCIGAPLLSSAAGMAATGNASLLGAVTFSMGAVIATDALVQKVKSDDCARCVVSRTNPMRRYGNMLIVAAFIGAATHMMRHGTGAHGDTETLCLPDGKTITIEQNIPVYYPQ